MFVGNLEKKITKNWIALNERNTNKIALAIMTMYNNEMPVFSFRFSSFQMLINRFSYFS